MVPAPKRSSAACRSRRPSACGALAAWGTWPGWEFDFIAAHLFAAAVAAEVWADVAAAADVEGESGRAAGGGVVAVAPFH
jgi:hypothetical protein